MGQRGAGGRWAATPSPPAPTSRWRRPSRCPPKPRCRPPPSRSTRERRRCCGVGDGAGSLLGRGGAPTPTGPGPACGSPTSTPPTGPRGRGGRRRQPATDRVGPERRSAGHDCIRRPPTLTHALTPPAGWRTNHPRPNPQTRRRLGPALAPAPRARQAQRQRAPRHYRAHRLSSAGGSAAGLGRGLAVNTRSAPFPPPTNDPRLVSSSRPAREGGGNSTARDLGMGRRRLDEWAGGRSPAGARRARHGLRRRPRPCRPLRWSRTRRLVRQDTWEWDGRAGSERTRSRQPVRPVHPAMAYDPVRGRVVLFGGRDDGGSPGHLGVGRASWVNVTPERHKPGGTRRHAMAYDGRRGRIVLFGGDGGSRAPGHLGVGRNKLGGGGARRHKPERSRRAFHGL